MRRASKVLIRVDSVLDRTLKSSYKFYVIYFIFNFIISFNFEIMSRQFKIHHSEDAPELFYGRMSPEDSVEEEEKEEDPVHM